MVEEQEVLWRPGVRRALTLGGLNGDLEVIFDLVLPDELTQPLRAQLQLERRVVIHRHRRDDALAIRIVFGQWHAAAIVTGSKVRAQRACIFTSVYKCAYNSCVHFEWHPGKAATNLAKHGVHFADAIAVLEDDLALTIRDPHLGDEERWISIGMDTLGRILVVVYTWRGEGIRLISARPAMPRERRQYEESNET